MRLYLILAFSFIFSILCAQGISYRIEAMGEDMVGIISDYETDLLRNPAYVTYQNYVRIQQTQTSSYFEGYTRFSSVIIKNPYGLLIDGCGRYSGSQSFRYFYHLRTLTGFKINTHSFGLEPSIELYREKATIYDIDLSYFYEDRIFRYKLGAIVNKRNQHEITISIIDFMENITCEESTYTNHEYRRLIVPRLIYLYNHKIANTSKIFRLYLDIGHKYSLDQLDYASIINYTDWTGKLAIGWENMINPKLLVGYAGVCKSNIVVFSTTQIRTNNRIEFPFSIEYNPWDFLFLRSGITPIFIINYNYLNYTTQPGDWHWFVSTGLSRSIGLGLKYKKLNFDFVIPTSSILDLNEWKTAFHFNF